MASTKIRAEQIVSVKRQILDTTTSGSAVIAKAVAGTGISISSTGTDTGTGDVTISAGGLDLQYIASTIFETANRFTTTLIGSGTCTFNGSGVVVATGLSNNGSASLNLNASSDFDTMGSDRSLTTRFTTMIRYSSFASENQLFLGVGSVTVAAAGITFTPRHFGFKLVKTGGTATWYATNADGTTETATSFTRTTTAGSDTVLAAVLVPSTNIKYYESGVLKATQTTNIPTSTSPSRQGLCCIGNSNAGDVSTNASNLIVDSWTYQQNAF